MAMPSNTSPDGLGMGYRNWLAVVTFKPLGMPSTRMPRLVTRAIIGSAVR